MAKRKHTRTDGANGARRTRAVRPFPASTFSEALELASSIQQHSGGQPIRRLTLFDQLGKSPDSGPSRQLITNSNKYGLTEGGYQAETLSLTEDGRLITSDETSPKDRGRTKIKVAILNIEPFKSVYERFVGNKLPARAVLIDEMKAAGVPEELAEEAVDIFVVNARDVAVLQTLAGADRLLTVDHAVESFPSAWSATPTASAVSVTGHTKPRDDADFATTCFYITPIGPEGSEERKHSDLFLSWFDCGAFARDVWSEGRACGRDRKAGSDYKASN